MKLDPKHLHRRGDHSTSIEAAMSAAKASPEVLRFVYRLMQDGVARNDYEIWCRAVAARVQLPGSTEDCCGHARNALCRAGVLVRTGKKHPTGHRRYGDAYAWTPGLRPCDISSLRRLVRAGDATRLSHGELVVCMRELRRVSWREGSPGPLRALVARLVVLCDRGKGL